MVKIFEKSSGQCTEGFFKPAHQELLNECHLFAMSTVSSTLFLFLDNSAGGFYNSLYGEVLCSMRTTQLKA